MGLEYTAVHPGKVSNLICLNGTHGHIIDSALQPIFRMPWVGFVFRLDFVVVLFSWLQVVPGNPDIAGLTEG